VEAVKKTKTVTKRRNTTTDNKAMLFYWCIYAKASASQTLTNTS
jgi:hypothetical protein